MKPLIIGVSTLAGEGDGWGYWKVGHDLTDLIGRLGEFGVLRVLKGFLIDLAKVIDGI